MKPVARRDFSVRFVTILGEDDAHLDAGVRGVRLNEIATVPFVPPIPNRAADWPPPAFDDEPATARELRLAIVAESEVSVVGDDGGERVEALDDRVVFFVAPARLDRFLSEIARAREERRGGEFGRSWIEFAELEVIRFLRHTVLESPQFPRATRKLIVPDAGLPARPELTCPRCGSHRVRGGKIGVAGGSVLDYWCETCGLLEERTSDGADLVGWVRRWQPTGSG